MLILDTEQTEEIPALDEFLRDSAQSLWKRGQLLRQRASRFRARLRRRPAPQPGAGKEAVERDEG